QEMRLADNFIERPRAHSLRQRGARKRRVVVEGRRAHGVQDCVCRRASYKIRPTVTLTLSELTPGRMGTVTRASEASMMWRGNPDPSFRTSTRVGWRGSRRVTRQP